MKSLCVITGAYPPDICGVGDYTHKLVGALRDNIDVEVYCQKHWGFFDFLKHVSKLRSRDNATVFNMQSPTTGFEGKFWPYFLPLFLFGRVFTSTIHEFSRKSFAGKLLMQFIFIFSRQLIFTTDKEMRSACRFNPFIKNKAVIIPIGSNIPAANIVAPSRDIDLACFGLIRPGKGIEVFLDTAERYCSKMPIKVALVGLVVPEFEDYFSSLKPQLERLNIEIHLGLTDIEAANFLTRVKCCLLPFPDGLSFRRGSALAAMLNGALVVSTKGIDTEAQLYPIALLADSDLQLFDKVVEGLSLPADNSIVVGAKSLVMELSWTSIANKYLSTIFKVN